MPGQHRCLLDVSTGCFGLSGKERGGGGLVLVLINSGLNLDRQSLELPLVLPFLLLPFLALHGHRGIVYQSHHALGSGDKRWTLQKLARASRKNKIKLSYENTKPQL